MVFATGGLSIIDICWGGPSLAGLLMVALTSSMIELVNATIKYAVAPMEVGLDLAL